MKKFRSLKDLPFFEKGTPKPKFKVGDYAVYEGNNIEYIKIFNVKKSGLYFIYNSINTADGFYVSYNESTLREPTQEELQTYFR